jgi:hypothetical protein
VRDSRSRVFRVELGYLVALGILFVVYTVAPGFRNALPHRLGDLPIGVPWFGAVGGTLISLTGIFKHAADWKPESAPWHYARPLVCAFLGSIGALLFFVAVNTASTRGGKVNDPVYEVIAFLVGYREATFRSLIQRATDLLLSSGHVKPDDPGDGSQKRGQPATELSEAE